MTKSQKTNGQPQGLDIPVGAKLSLEVLGIDEKLSSALVGYAKGKYLVVQLPSLTEGGRDMLFQYLYSGNPVTVRYLKSGAVFGFRCEIIKYLFSPFPLLFLTFPLRVESFNLRRHRRIPCLLPVSAMIKEATYTGLMTDLSLSGCGVGLTIMRKYQPTIGVDDRVLLSCLVFGDHGQNNLHCLIKRAASDVGKLELGLKFTELPEASRQGILSYIQSAAAILEN
ncbi:flagellar brake protein [Desulfolutivibrio sp.]|uniref:flagellar brake protein n=1 Tax=Desulfolutivibrio sp. TaxID=2773296 RepID=UPI002F966051